MPSRNPGIEEKFSDGSRRWVYYSTRCAMENNPKAMPQLVKFVETWGKGFGSSGCHLVLADPEPGRVKIWGDLSTLTNFMNRLLRKKGEVEAKKFEDLLKEVFGEPIQSMWP